MDNVYFIGDLHLGHKSICHWAGDYRIKNFERHDRWIVEQWNRVVDKRDKVFVLGDVSMQVDKLNLIKEMNGDKHLILGNHDKFETSVYIKYFGKVTGPIKYKNFWVTHIPIHPQELFGMKNIHGHVHQNYIKDPRYINVSVETNYAMPINFTSIQDGSHYEFYTQYIDSVKGEKNDNDLW